MSTLVVDTIRATTDGGMITIGDVNSPFVIPAGATIGTGPDAEIPSLTQNIAVAMSDEDTPLDSESAPRASIHMPYDFTVTGISAGLTTAHDTDMTISFIGLGTFMNLIIPAGVTESTAPGIGTEPTQIPTGGLNINENQRITAQLSTLTSTGGTGLKFYITGVSR